MKGWTEFHIGLVYYSALIIAFFAGILSIIYLRPADNILKLIKEKTGVLWSRSFISTLIMAGVLGAMAVTFNGCDSDYRDFLGQRDATLQVGLRQVSSACISIAFITWVWFLIFLILRLSDGWRIKAGPFIRVLIAFVFILCLLELYQSLKTGTWLDFLNPFSD